ncbi:hypothetical protein KXD40_003754 [Peronospora effusa]|nr:hypothetical protein KXD40_003754 [Peronospora effusa]
MANWSGSRARLVVLSNRQTYGDDYFNTYSPIANMNLIRVFLAVCCHHGMAIQQYDADATSIKGLPEQDVYILSTYNQIKF